VIGSIIKDAPRRSVRLRLPHRTRKRVRLILKWLQTTTAGSRISTRKTHRTSFGSSTSL